MPSEIIYVCKNCEFPGSTPAKTCPMCGTLLYLDWLDRKLREQNYEHT